MKKIIYMSMLLFLALSTSVQAETQHTPSGTISAVRTYPYATDGLRVQITLSGTTHECGTSSTLIYYDSNKIPMDVVKSVMSLAFGAMLAGKSIVATYDCTLAGGGWGWGWGLQVVN